MKYSLHITNFIEDISSLYTSIDPLWVVLMNCKQNGKFLSSAYMSFKSYKFKDNILGAWILRICITEVRLIAYISADSPYT